MIQNFQKSGFSWPKLSTFFWQKSRMRFELEIMYKVEKIIKKTFSRENSDDFQFF